MKQSHTRAYFEIENAEAANQEQVGRTNRIPEMTGRLEENLARNLRGKLRRRVKDGKHWSVQIAFSCLREVGILANACGVENDVIIGAPVCARQTAMTL